MEKRTLASVRRLVKSGSANGRLRNRPGIVLIIVLVVVVLLALAAYTFSDLTISQRRVVDAKGQQLQAQALVDSGIAALQTFLAQDAATQEVAGGWHNNPSRFQRVIVVDEEDTGRRGSFTVLSPALDYEGNVAGVRYGLEDESTRLNLNLVLHADKFMKDGSRTLLMTLPNMNEEIADAILDWLDEDDEPRPFGAESDYYAALQPAYVPHNGPIPSVEDLLLVRGVTAQLLFGSDWNHNGLVDPHEQERAFGGGDNEASAAFENGDDQSGWARHLTTYSQEDNRNQQGEERVYLNSDDLEELHDRLRDVLDDEWATFIVGYRQNGPYSEDANVPGGSNALGGDDDDDDDDDDGDDAATSSGDELDFTQPARYAVRSILDIAGQRIRVQFEDASTDEVIASPFQEENLSQHLPKLMESVTPYPGDTIPGRININRSARLILEGIPGLEEGKVSEILSLRDEVISQADVDPNRQYETWPLTEGIVDLKTMRDLMLFVCASGTRYRAQVVGFYDGRGTSARREFVIDATAKPLPRVLLSRDLSHLGRGYSLATLGVLPSDLQ